MYNVWFELKLTVHNQFCCCSSLLLSFLLRILRISAMQTYAQTFLQLLLLLLLLIFHIIYIIIIVNRTCITWFCQLKILHSLSRVCCGHKQYKHANKPHFYTEFSISITRSFCIAQWSMRRVDGGIYIDLLHCNYIVLVTRFPDRAFDFILYLLTFSSPFRSKMFSVRKGKVEIKLQFIAVCA